jgi:hypothetical protein
MDQVSHQGPRVKRDDIEKQTSNSYGLDSKLTTASTQLDPVDTTASAYHIPSTLDTFPIPISQSSRAML